MDAFGQSYGEEIQLVLCKALEEISLQKQYHYKCLSIVVRALQSFKEQASEDTHSSYVERLQLFSRFRSMLSSTLMTTLPHHFPEILHWYFKEKLEELSAIMDEDDSELQENDSMDLDEKLRYKNRGMDVDEGYPQGKYSRHYELVKNIGKVVRGCVYCCIEFEFEHGELFYALKKKLEKEKEDLNKENQSLL